MNYFSLKKIILLITMAMSACTHIAIVPETPLHVTMDTFLSDLEIIESCISEENYLKIYNEIFSDSLKERIGSDEFATMLTTYSDKYGSIRNKLSYTKSMSNQKDPFRVIIHYIFEYELKTIYVEYTFTGSEKEMRLDDYYFTEY